MFTKFLFTIFAPLNPPPPNQHNDGFPLEFLLKAPQTELRTLSKNCEQTLQKLRTNRVVNKQAFLKPLNAPFLNGLLSSGFSRDKTAPSGEIVETPIKVGKRPIKEGKRPIKAMVLVSISVGCLMGCFRAPPPWRKTAPLKRPIKRSMNFNCIRHIFCSECWEAFHTCALAAQGRVPFFSRSLHFESEKPLSHVISAPKSHNRNR